MAMENLNRFIPACSFDEERKAIMVQTMNEDSYVRLSDASEIYSNSMKKFKYTLDCIRLLCKVSIAENKTIVPSKLLEVVNNCCSNTRCCFSTDITEQLSCSKDGKFDEYGFPINKCSQFPCEKYEHLRKKVEESQQIVLEKEDECNSESS